jgi:pyruvate dehydrogenase E1 component alpha subunit
LFSEKQLININRVMNRIREFEGRSLTLYKEGIVTGSVHLYIGEEAVAAAACELLDERDSSTQSPGCGGGTGKKRH